jgi:hypothetical protein
MPTEMSYNAEMSTEPAAETGETVVNSPFCRELRSKKYFFLDTIATDASQYLDGSNHCWCSRTQMVIGPDGDSVAPDLCVPGRPCYRSALADLA